MCVCVCGLHGCSLVADGGRNEKLMGKIPSNMFILSVKARKKNPVTEKAKDLLCVRRRQTHRWRQMVGGDGENAFQHVPPLRGRGDLLGSCTIIQLV